MQQSGNSLLIKNALQLGVRTRARCLKESLLAEVHLEDKVQVMEDKVQAVEDKVQAVEEFCTVEEVFHVEDVTITEMVEVAPEAVEDENLIDWSNGNLIFIFWLIQRQLYDE
jgi:predicted nuclease with TOPRIM domain